MRRAVIALVLLAAVAAVGWQVARTYIVIRPLDLQDQVDGAGGEQPGLIAKGAQKQDRPEGVREIDARELLRGLRSEDSEERDAAYENAAAAERLPFDEDLVRLMIVWLRSGDSVRAKRAYAVLLRVGPRVLQHTEPLLRSPDGVLRIWGLIFYGGLKRFGFENVAYPPMLPFLEDEDDRVRRVAMSIVSGGIPYDEDVAAYLLDQIKPSAGALYYGPEAGLARMGPKGVAHILAMLDDPKLLYNGLGGLHSAPADVIRSILPRLGRLIEDDSNEDAQLAAVQLLFKLEGDFEVLLPTLTKALRGESFVVRNAILMALEQMEGRAAPALDVVIEALDDSDERIANRAAGILGDLGAQPEKVLPALREALRGDAARAAAVSSGQFGLAALPYLQDAMDHGDEDERYAALHGVAVLGPKAEPLRERVIGMLEIDDYELQTLAAATIGKLGVLGAPGIPGILRLLREDVLTPGSAAGILIEIGKPAEAAILTELRSGDDARRLPVVHMLGAFHGRSAFAIDDLAPFLQDDDAQVRLAALRAIACSTWATSIWDGVKPANDPPLWRRVRALIDPLQRDKDSRVNNFARRNVAELDRMLR